MRFSVDSTKINSLALTAVSMSKIRLTLYNLVNFEYEVSLIS